MEEFVKSITEKITSYNLFNNLLPGVVFCHIIETHTRFTLVSDNLLETIFIYYFLGTVISRIGSVLIEKFLRNLTINNRKTKKKEKFLNFASYQNYMKAEQINPFIKTLSETNNMYRTILATLVTSLLVKLYDLLLYDFLMDMGLPMHDISFFIVSIILVVLFAHSHQKQTDYIRMRVDDCINKHKEKQEV